MLSQRVEKLVEEIHRLPGRNYSARLLTPTQWKRRGRGMQTGETWLIEFADGRQRELTVLKFVPNYVKFGRNRRRDPVFWLQKWEYTPIRKVS